MAELSSGAAKSKGVRDSYENFSDTVFEIEPDPFFSQVLLAVELLVFNLATAVFYPQRGLGRHIADLLKMVAGLAFVLFFLVITYGIVAEGDNGNALMAGLTALRSIGDTAVVWTALYIADCKPHQAVARLKQRRTHQRLQRHHVVTARRCFI